MPYHQAHVEDAEDSETPIRRSRRSESKEPRRTKAGESKSGKSKKSGETSYLPDSSRNAQERSAKLERRGSVSNSKSPHKQTRHSEYPPLATAHAKTRTDSTYYGIQPPPHNPTPVTQGIPIRPRISTTQTAPPPRPYYYPHSASTPGPPISNSAYYQQQYSQFPPPSFPPPASPASSYMAQYAASQPQMSQYSVAPQYQVTQQPGQDYFAPQTTGFTPQATARPLASRFDPIGRTQSAFGTRDVTSRTAESSYDPYYEDEYLSETEVAPPRTKGRRSSRSYRPDADTLAMPPPPAPATRRPSILRKSVNLDYDTAEQEYDSYDTRTQYREEPRGLTRRPHPNRKSVSYDQGTGPERVRIEPANTGRRRQSYYDSTSTTAGASDYTDKYSQAMNQAASYQETVLEPSVPLTAEHLKRQQRKVAGSKSSKSSASRDESDYRKSVTTRTTRSGSGPDDENVLIKVKGKARLTVGGTQIDCEDGGTIEIERDRRLPEGSERSMSEYGERRQIEDRRSRVAPRPSAGRSRMSSHFDPSYTSSPQYPDYI